jgi:hypothetical protein
VKAFLLHEDHDFDWAADPLSEEPDLVRDLGLDTLFDAMGAEDAFVRATAAHVALAPLTDPESIIYRQRILGDWLHNPEVLTEMYDLAVETIDNEHWIWPGFLRSPDSVMYRAVQAMDLFTARLRRLRKLADDHVDEISSPGLTRFFRMLRAELDDPH